MDGEDDGASLFKQSIGQTIVEKYELIDKIETISQHLAIIPSHSPPLDEEKEESAEEEPSAIFTKTTFHDRGRHLIALMDAILGYENLDRQMQTEIRTRSFQILCLMFRTLICTGMKMSPAVISHPGIVYILPPESEQFVPEFEDVDGSFRVDLTSARESEDGHRRDDVFDSEDIGVGRERRAAGMLEPEDFDTAIQRVLPSMEDTIGKLRKFETTIEGVMNVFDAYNTAAKWGPPALRRTYVEAANSRRKRSWTVLGTLESRNVTSVDLLDLMEPRTMYLQTGVLYLRKNEPSESSSPDTQQPDSELSRSYSSSSSSDDYSKYETKDEDGCDDDDDDALSTDSSESADYGQSIENGPSSARNFEIFYDDTFDGCTKTSSSQDVNPKTSRRHSRTMEIRKFVSETQNQDALRIALNNDVDEFVGSPMVSAYVKDHMLGHDPKLHAHVQTIHSLVRSKSLPEGSMRSMELVYHGFMNLVVSPQVLLSTPWVLMGMDFIQSFVIAIVMTILSWNPPGSRASALPIILQALISLSSFETTEKYLSVHTTSHPLSLASRIHMRRRKFRTYYDIPIVSFVRRCTALCSTAALLLNLTILASSRDYVEKREIVVLAESCASALLATLCILNLCKLGFLWKKTGTVLSAIQASFGDIASAVAISCIAVVSFATALHALAIHRRELGAAFEAEEDAESQHAFVQGVFETSIVLVDMVISKKTFFIFSKEGEIMKHAFSASMTGILITYSLFANILVMNIILSIVVSVYRSISQSDTRLYASRTKIMYSYVQDSRLKVFPGPVGVLVGFLRYACGSTISRLLFSSCLAVTFIPVAAVLWSVLFVKVMWSILVHQLWIVYGAHTYMPREERRSLAFPYLFIVLDRIGGCESTVGAWVSGIILSLVFVVCAVITLPLFPIFICAHFVFRYTTMEDSRAKNA
jgi:hypothetical protein